MKRLLSLIPGVIVFAVALTGCDRGSKGGPPAAAPATKSEGDLAILTISPKAYASLQIKSALPRFEPVQEHAEYTGWIMVPQGNEVTLTAPQAGYIEKTKLAKAGPVAGIKVAEKQELFQLVPVLSPIEEYQMEALKRDVASELAKAQTSLKFADLDLKRAKDLHDKGLKGQQDLDKAQERKDQAQETLNAAKDKQKLFVEKQPIPIKAPLGGTVLIVHANPGEFVAKSAPLVTIADLGKLWVRVPIPEYDVPGVKNNLPITVALKGYKAPAKKKTATVNGVFAGKPVALVPQVDLQKHTVDLIYELSPLPLAEIAQKSTKPGSPAADLPEGEPSTAGAKSPAAKSLPFVKDQMVTVQVPLGEKKKELIVPYSAVVYDTWGGKWIYRDMGKKFLDEAKKNEVHLFKMIRVQLGPAVDGGIVVRPLTAKDLDDDDQVVTHGAAALFSSEFFSAPGTPAAADLDDDD